MADPTTVNTSLAVPLRGADAGTWDVPVNGNFTSIDAMMGGVTSVPLVGANVTLTSSQALVNIIRLTGTLTGNVTVTLPGIYKSWTIDNQLTNSPSSFAATLVSTSGASIIGCPPGPQDVFYDGTTLNYRNLGRIGEYWDYAGATVPTWVTASTKPPYLNCTAATFSSATYPILANLLGTTTLPDSRGNVRASLNQGTNRVTNAVSAVNGDVIFTVGGSQSMQSHQHGVNGDTGTMSANDPHSHSVASTQGGSIMTAGSGGGPIGQAAIGSGLFVSTIGTGATSINHSHHISFTSDLAGFGGTQNIQPTYIGGITMIRAA